MTPTHFSSGMAADHEQSWLIPDNGQARPFASPLPLLEKLWQTILRRWVLIAAVVTLCISAGIIITMLQTRLYTARAQIELSRAQKNITSVEGVEQSNYYDSEFYETQYALLKTASLAARLARKLQLADDPSFFAAHGVVLADQTSGSGAKPVLTPAERKQREGQAAGMLLGAVQIAPVLNSSLVNISYTSQSPEWSARIANAWPQEFIAATMDRQFATTADARRFLEQRLDALRLRLTQSERDLITFGAQRNIVAIGGSRDAAGKTEAAQTLVASNLGALNSALVTARTERIAAQSRLRSAAGESSPEMLQNVSVAPLRAKRAEAAGEYARLMVQFEPGYPAARALKQQMDALDAAINRETARAGNSRLAAYNEALSREQQLAGQVAATKALFDQQQRDTIQYGIYQREVDTNRQLYDALLQRYKEIGVAGSVGVTNIVIADQAKVPSGPSSPNLTRNLMTAILIGMALAGGLVLGIERLDHGIRDPGEAEELLGVPLLGVIPPAASSPIEEFLDPKSDISEAYQSIRATLAFATNHGFPRSLLVTSSRAEEGKSTTAFALAVAICRTGQRVVLVDADMRSPSVHEIVGCQNTPGLSNFLAGEADALAMVMATSISGLSVLPAGPTPPNAAELLSHQRLGVLMTSLLQKFDFVVVDAPPVLGIADAPLLGAAVQGCILVAEADKTPVGAIRTSLNRLVQVNTRVFGVVLSKIDLKRHPYGYGYGYGHESKGEREDKAA